MKKLILNDIKDALKVLQVICIPDLDLSPKEIREFQKSLKEIYFNKISDAKIKIEPIKKFKHYDNGRRPSVEKLNNPIIVAKYKKTHVVLDGNHRVIVANKNKIKCLPSVVLDFSDNSMFSEILDYL
jgi:hypothetical protein